MKKIFFIAISMMLMIGTASAQIKEDVQKSQVRATELQKLCDDYKTCGNGNIDDYGNAVKAAAIFAISNSKQLETLYQRQIGETKDGVTDVTIKKPTLTEWSNLATTVAGETLSIKTATDKAQAAVEEAKDISEMATKEKNPMKVAKAATHAKLASAIVSFGNEATPILLDESAAQAKAIKSIIDTLKSGKNL